MARSVGASSPGHSELLLGVLCGERQAWPVMCCKMLHGVTRMPRALDVNCTRFGLPSVSSKAALCLRCPSHSLCPCWDHCDHWKRAPSVKSTLDTHRHVCCGYACAPGVESGVQWPLYYIQGNCRRLHFIHNPQLREPSPGIWPSQCLEHWNNQSGSQPSRMHFSTDTITKQCSSCTSSFQLILALGNAASDCWQFGSGQKPGPAQPEGSTVADLATA